MVKNNQSKYGFGKNPPYSLYQAPDGKWGLIDGSGQKLEAVFNRGNGNCFSCVPWEVVCFDPQEGFELQAWFDPDEVWFNFIFGNPDYPPEYTQFLWGGKKCNLEEIFDSVSSLLPEESTWLLGCMKFIEKEDDMTEEEFDKALKQLLLKYRALKEPSKLNPLLEPIMHNQNVSKDIKRTIWNAKVHLDYSLKYII